MKIIFKTLALVCAAVACNREILHEPYLNLGITSYTFSYAEGELEVPVSTNMPWTAVADQDWIDVQVLSESVLLSVSENSGSDRNGTVSFTADGVDREVSFTVGQLARDFQGSIDYVPDNVQMIYSPSGTCAVMIEQLRTDMGLPYYEMWLKDTRTGSVSALDLLEASVRNTGDIAGVSDSGHVLFNNAQNDRYSILYEGAASELELPGDVFAALASGISADGSVVAGTAFKQLPEYNISVPCVWRNGVYEELEMPDSDLEGNPDKYGAIVYGMSADGSLVWGCDNFSVNYVPVEGLMYWKDGKLSYVGKETAEPVSYEQWGMEVKDYELVRKMASPGPGVKASADGRYLIAEKNKLTVKDNVLEAETVCPVLIDTETGKVTVFEGKEDMCAFTVTDEGLVFGAMPYYSVVSETGAPCDGVVMDASGNVQDITDYFMDLHGVILSDKDMIYGIFPQLNMYQGMKLTGTSMYGGVYKYFSIITE